MRLAVIPLPASATTSHRSLLGCGPGLPHREAQTNALNLLGTTLFEIGACETEFLAVNTFAAISRNTLEIMKIKYLP